MGSFVHFSGISRYPNCRVSQSLSKSERRSNKKRKGKSASNDDVSHHNQPHVLTTRPPAHPPIRHFARFRHDLSEDGDDEQQRRRFPKYPPDGSSDQGQPDVDDGRGPGRVVVAVVPPAPPPSMFDTHEDEE